MHTTPTPQPSVLAHLRSLMPRRGLDEPTALGIAERQALALLALSGSSQGGPISLTVIARLPHIRLTPTRGLPAAGSSFWTGQHWQLESNADESIVRQRFTLAHEFKHVIDHPGRDLFYANHGTRERVADHFAACLLMPKPQVTQAWCSGEQDIARLADLFVVSASAMERRLRWLGLLTAPVPRRIFCTRGLKPLQSKGAFAIAGGRSIGEQP